MPEPQREDLPPHLLLPALLQQLLRHRRHIGHQRRQAVRRTALQGGGTPHV
jgi:hypothetical protein